jgi:biotin transport system substrate-specific component
MSTIAHSPARHVVLADLAAGTRLRTLALVVGGAALTAVAAQIAIPIPPSPVPVTAQTLAVLLAGAALGARRGAASQALYLLAGLFLPVYSDGGQGLSHVWGATGGYLVGFVLAAYVIGLLAERGADRRVLSAFAIFVAGQVIVFGIGVPWLMVATGMDLATALHHGFAIFIVGGLFKAGAGGLLVPSAWRLARRIEGR